MMTKEGWISENDLAPHAGDELDGLPPSEPRIVLEDSIQPPHITNDNIDHTPDGREMNPGYAGTEYVIFHRNGKDISGDLDRQGGVFENK